MLIIVVILALGAIATGILRNKRFRKKQNIYHQFTSKNHLKLAFRNPKNFTIYGEYRGFSIRVEPNRELKQNGNSSDGVIFQLPLVNPNLKAIRIVKKNNKYPWIQGLFPIDQVVAVKNTLGDEVIIQTNDMLFSSFLLSEDLLIDMGVLFTKLDAGIIFIHNDVLGCIIPHYIYENNMEEVWQRVMDILCDIKEELIMK